MQTTSRVAMSFAVAPTGRIAHINQVENGAACQCTCPHCHAPLIAKNGGQERAHHFAHDNSSEFAGCAETALHLAAKQLISDHKRITKPAILNSSGLMEMILLDTVELEYRMENPANGDWIVADCYTTTCENPLIIEIAVNHHVDPAKADKLKALDIPAIEIDLSDWAHQPWDWNDLEEAVLKDPRRRSWIHFPVEPAPEITQLVETTRTSWVFSFNGKKIWVRQLPFANLTVFHWHDDQLRSIVEPICRGRGKWQSGHRNWLVFERFKNDLLAQRSARCTLLPFESI